MGIKEVQDLFDESKNKYYRLNLTTHWAWLPISLLYRLFDWIFSPNFEAWPKKIVALIEVTFGAYCGTAIAFGLMRILFNYLGVITREDFVA